MSDRIITPKVIINVRTGVVESVFSNILLDVEILDDDIEGVSDPEEQERINDKLRKEIVDRGFLRVYER